MDRYHAAKQCREALDKYGLTDWGVRISSDPNQPFLGLCIYKDKVIVINAHHCDIHPDNEVTNTILHEVAHALCPGQGHNDVWANRAREIGCTNTLPCSHLSLPDHVIDAIRSGQMVEMTVEEETQVIRKPKYTVTRLQDKCPDCGAVAKEKFAIETVDKEGNQVKLITLECFHIIKRVIPRGTPFETMISNFWKPEVQACKHEFPSSEIAKEKHIPSNQCVKCGEFRPYQFQITGAKFVEMALAIQKGAGIFDDMGLGKTIQALMILKFHSDKYCPTLIVTKSAIKFQWFKAAVTWLGPKFIGQILSTSRDPILPGLNIYIAPYDLLRRFPKEKLHSLNIKCIVLDEVQQIKNPDSSRTQAVRKLVGANTDCKVIELSGTPWKNRGSEFFPALNLIDPIKFYSYQHYLDHWVDFYYEGPKRKMGGIRNVKKFKEFTQNLIIRREYEEVMDEFPTVNRMKLPVQLDELQQTTYDDTVSDFIEWYNDFILNGEEEKASGIEILAKMSRMRHVTGLAKIPATLSFVEQFIEDTDRKLVIFVHHKDVGELITSSLKDCNKETNPEWYELATELRNQGIRVLQYTSAHTGRPEGFQIQETFNATKRCIMIASTLACGEGLNLQTCADSILHERQWNPQNEDQATPGRFRRIGQASNVINITCPEAEGTIDEHLDYINTTKRRNFHIVMNKSEIQHWNETEFARELANIIIQKHKSKKAKSGNTRVTKLTQVASGF